MTEDSYEVTSLREEIAALKKELDASNRKYQRLRSRRSVRLAIGLATLAAPIMSRVGRILPARSSSGPAAKPSMIGRARGRRAQRRLASDLSRMRSTAQRASGPLVSIIVLTRDGAGHLKRLLEALERSTYRTFELIVVDNGSTDGSAEVLRQPRSYPLQTIHNDRNVSFSEGNNQGARVATGQYLLFLNNDVEPINPGWLGAMVDAVETEGIVACGALLVFPYRGDPVTDLTVQHRGIHFGFRIKAVRAYNTIARDPRDPRLLGVTDVPAATAAALIVDAGVFDAVAGFDERYVYGREDVDLALKMRRWGRTVVAGHAVLFHHESATISQLTADVVETMRVKNRQLFNEIWSPTLTRSVVRDRLRHRHEWTKPRARTVAITLTHDDPESGWGDYYTAHELGDAFTAQGWYVIYAERHLDRWYEIQENDEIDLLISLLDSYDVRRAPDGAVTIAWVRNWVDRWIDQPWFASYDIVAGSSHKAAEQIQRRSRFRPTVVPLATNPDRFRPGPTNPLFAGEYAFTGNNWGLGREVLKSLDVHRGERFSIFGKGWESDPLASRYWRGHLSYDFLPDVYRSTKLVLDDAATHTLPYGQLNSRVFDALSAGSLVISNNADGSNELFGGRLPTYTNSEELRAQLDHFLSDEASRADLAADLRAEVLEKHTYKARVQEFIRLAIEHNETVRAAIKISVPQESVRPQWGDTHFAEGLASALARRGIPTEVHILPDWYLPTSQAVDVVIHLRGLDRYKPSPGHINVLWIISHPETVTPAECENYDIVFAASRQYATWLQTQIATPVVYLPQATDARRFHATDEQAELATDVLFVGNTRGQSRPGVEWAAEADLPVAVYGEGWTDRIGSRFLRGTHFPNDRLVDLYASAKVVLNDHWPDMRDRGFISNRIFDALASGSVVVSDQVDGLSETFGDLVPTYSDPNELATLVKSLLEDEERRRQISASASSLIAQHHTMDHRAEDIVSHVEKALVGRPSDLDGSLWTFDSGPQVPGARGFCPVCGTALDRFLRGPNGRPWATCPVCASLERHRFLAVLLDALEHELVSARHVVEIAPTPSVTRLLRRSTGLYTGLDIDPSADGRSVDVVGDLCRAPIATGSVDVAVCFHVFEHIPDDRSAMSELARLLSPSGFAFVQVPWRKDVPTDEDPGASTEERLRRFGQADHVRMYGTDLESRMHESGLRSVRVDAASVLSERTRTQMAIGGTIWITTSANSSRQPQDLEVLIEKRLEGTQPT